jgi:uroporphyrinogen-III decarboxylase
MISPEMFRGFALPCLGRLVRAIHENGAKAGLHICGDTRAVLRDMAATGADLLSIDEMDLGFARAEVGAGRALMGNVSTTLLLDGTPEQVEVASGECLAKGGLLLLSTSCDVPANAPRDNVQAVVKAARSA